MRTKIQGCTHHILMELCLGCRADDKLHILSDSKIAHHAHQMFNFMRYLAGGERLMPKDWLFQEECIALNSKIFARPWLTYKTCYVPVPNRLPPPFQSKAFAIKTKRES